MANDKAMGNQPTNNQPTNDRGTNNRAVGAAAGAQPATDDLNRNTNSMQNPQAARGGKQEDQLSGETQKGARNNEVRGANHQNDER
jgi:hypothetical protein